MAGPEVKKNVNGLGEVGEGRQINLSGLEEKFARSWKILVGGWNEDSVLVISVVQEEEDQGWKDLKSKQDSSITRLDLVYTLAKL